MIESRPMRRLIRKDIPVHGRSLCLCTAWQALTAFLLLVACGTTSNLTPIGEGPLGAVVLERLASRGTTARYSNPQNAFQASHPATLSVSVVSRLLAGLSISGIDRPGRVMAEDSYPLFSHEEAEFLVPLIVGALAQAQPDQRVRFIVHDDGLKTQGTLYLHKATLRVSLSHYRSSPAEGETRPPTLNLAFTPSEALVQVDTPQTWMIVEPEQPRVAVSTDALNQLSALSPAPSGNKAVIKAAPASPASEQNRLQQELQSTKDVVVKQAEELQKLKAELESVRRQLAEQESATSKAKPKTAPRKPTPTP
jgi:hypothetical protein